MNGSTIANSATTHIRLNSPTAKDFLQAITKSALTIRRVITIRIHPTNMKKLIICRECCQPYPPFWMRDGECFLCRVGLVRLGLGIFVFMVLLTISYFLV